MDEIELMNEPGVWFALRTTNLGNVSYATIGNIPHLSHKSLWKEPATAAAAYLCDLLRKHGHLYPWCTICGQNCGIEAHIHSERHFKQLWYTIEAAQSDERVGGKLVMDNAKFYGG